MTKSMKTVQWLLVGGALSLVGAVTAQAADASVGTRWFLQNRTSRTVTVSCERYAESDGVRIALARLEVRAGAERVHDWGFDWYNDGLGLNAGIWTCQARSGLASDEVTFATDWGAEVRLVADMVGGRLSLSRGDD